VLICSNLHSIALTKPGIGNGAMRQRRAAKPQNAFPYFSRYFPVYPCCFELWKEAHTFARRNMRRKANRKRKI